jgi:flagellum-specific peptidoglycan hydrolase FlgJ
MGSIMVEGEISIPQVEVPADTPMTETTPEVSESANEIKAADEAEAKKEDGTDKNEKKDDSSDDEDKEPEGPVGHSAETKNLYAKYDKDQNRSWSDKIPEDLESAAENESTRKYALIARMSESQQHSYLLSTN